MQNERYYVGVRAERYKKRLCQRYMTLMLIMCSFLTLIAAVAVMFTVRHFNNRIDELQDAHTIALEELSAQYMADIKSYENQITELKAEIETISNTFDEYRDSSAYDFQILQKYWYVLRDAPDNSGLAISDLIYLDELAESKDLNPHIMTCIYKKESGYTVKIDNSKSSARGLGQILSSTGKSLYENVLQLGTYSHVYAYDAVTNITLTMELIDRNIDSGLYNAIAIYSGDSSGNYYQSLLSVAASYGVDITDTHYQ